VLQIVNNRAWLPEDPAALAREIDFCSVVRALIDEIDRIGAPVELRLIAQRMAREYRAAPVKGENVVTLKDRRA